MFFVAHYLLASLCAVGSGEYRCEFNLYRQWLKKKLVAVPDLVSNWVVCGQLFPVLKQKQTPHGIVKYEHYYTMPGIRMGGKIKSIKREFRNLKNE